MQLPTQSDTYKIFNNQAPRIHYYFYVPVLTAILLLGDGFLLVKVDIERIDKRGLFLLSLLLHLLFFYYLRYWSPRYAELRGKGILFSGFINSVYVKFEDIESLGKGDSFEWEDLVWEDYERRQQYLRIYLKHSTPMGRSVLVILKHKGVQHFGTTFLSEDFLKKLVNGTLSFCP